MRILHLFTALVVAVLPAAAADTKTPAKKTDPKKTEPKKNEPKKPDAKKPEAKPQRVKTDMVDEDAIALLKPYDKDTNFEIDVFEFETVEKDFKKNPKGPLKLFDKGKDGALDSMIDRIGMNVKLGSVAPKTKPAPKPAAPAEPKTEAPKAPDKPAENPEAAKPADKPAPKP